MIIYRAKQKNFLEDIEKHQKGLQEKDLLLFLDFDGTLAAIVEHFQDANISDSMRSVLEKLLHRDGCRITIVSGRALSDLKRRINLHRIVYVGNHGFEMQGPGVRFDQKAFPLVRHLYDRVQEKILKRFPGLSGLAFEDKGVTRSIHFRSVAVSSKEAVRLFIKQATREFAERKELIVRWGKEVCELRPPVVWDKGTAVRWLLKPDHADIKAKKTLVFYIGDDDTDEDAFRALRSLAITIHVGQAKTTAARYFLKDVVQVEELLKRLCELKKKGKITC
ncbi:MAG TPA: trehalose-phosphatase [Candidatus Omnitrophota bacterium]|nr:trehalose-phosphatase [Candidatus Omnitrophota bacterium]HQL40711.1 trehalose-phosphatase [Candidatus Omnitrophota bacterium]